MEGTHKGVVHTLHTHHGTEVDQIAHTGLLGHDDASGSNILGQFALRRTGHCGELSVGQSLDHRIEPCSIALGQIFHAAYSGLGDEPCGIDGDTRHAPQVGLSHPQIDLLHGGQLLIHNLAIVFAHLVDQPCTERIAFGSGSASLEQTGHIVDTQLAERVADALADTLDGEKRTAHSLGFLLCRVDNLSFQSGLIGSGSSVVCGGRGSGSIGLGCRYSVLHS